MSTIRDVAQRAGVSTMTVSRVINRSGYTSTETRVRVERAIADLGYVPNAVARHLRSKRTKTIALVLSDITNPFFTTIARGRRGRRRPARVRRHVLQHGRVPDRGDRLPPDAAPAPGRRRAAGAGGQLGRAAAAPALPARAGRRARPARGLARRGPGADRLRGRGLPADAPPRGAGPPPNRHAHRPAHDLDLGRPRRGLREALAEVGHRRRPGARPVRRVRPRRRLPDGEGGLAAEPRPDRPVRRQQLHRLRRAARAARAVAARPRGRLAGVLRRPAGGVADRPVPHGRRPAGVRDGTAGGGAAAPRLDGTRPKGGHAIVLPGEFIVRRSTAAPSRASAVA